MIVVFINSIGVVLKVADFTNELNSGINHFARTSNLQTIINYETEVVEKLNVYGT